MLSEALFDVIKDKAEQIQYTSMKYTDYSEISDYEVIKNEDNFILLRGYNPKMQWIEYHFAANAVDKLLESMNKSDKIHISFVPKEWTEAFKQQGFEVYAVFNDYFNLDISYIGNMGIDEPELLTDQNCEEAAMVTQSCKGQSRGFHGETTEWMRSWIKGEETSAMDTGAKDCAVLVHREDNRIVGVLCTATYAHQSEKGPISWIREVAVHPDYQQKGIARKLILQALNYGKSHGATRAFLAADECNEHAIHLYESLGFIGRKEDAQIDMILKIN